MFFMKCIGYIALIGILSFLIGRLLPKKWFDFERFPYRCWYFEDEGRYYERFKIRVWQNKVPDMSRIFPKMMPAKKLSENYKELLLQMIRETCVAELTHLSLCFAGLYCIKLWCGAGGIVIAVINVLMNIPFIMIQRYNRPRLCKLQKKLNERKYKHTVTTEV